VRRASASSPVCSPPGATRPTAFCRSSSGGFGDDAIEIDSPFLLLYFAQVDYYRHQATTLRERNGEAGELTVGDDGTIERTARPR
jgi:hypothetical protein